jgi:hypothetical protein
MAYSATTTSAPVNVRAILARPFVATFNFLVMLAESNSVMAEVTRLNNTSDADLAARGSNRADEVARIFKGRFYM